MKFSAITTTGFKATEATVETINDIIFKTATSKVPGLTESNGKSYLLDVATNTATEVNPTSVQEAYAKVVLGEDANETLASIGDSFNTLKKVTLVPNSEFAGSKNSLAILLAGNKVTAVEVATQNDVIFNAVTVKSMSNLTKSDGKYYSLDIAKNTATLVNPEEIATQAKADFMANDGITDLMELAYAFGLITTISLEAK